MAPPRRRTTDPIPQSDFPATPDPGAPLPVVERELRGWSVTGMAGDSAGAPVRVRFLDQIEAETGLTLTDVGGHSARLNPTTLGQRAGVNLIDQLGIARATWDQITADLEAARRRWRLAARALNESGMNTTRISLLLGVSRAAVDKLLRRASDEPAELVPTMTGLDLVAEVEQAQAQVEEVTRRQTEFSDRWAQVAFDLQDVLHSDRDVAWLMGVSRQRVHQLVQRAQQNGAEQVAQAAPSA